MKTVDLIRKKRDGEKLSREEIQFLIDGYVGGEIPDYQVSALLMAIYFKNMDDQETAILTDVMAHSGTMLDLSKMNGFPVDKHSTGGVGDTTSLVLIPLLAAAGLTVAKLSGRSLGHTGGTIDKLESIPGFRTDLSREEFLGLVEDSGFALADHTADMVPADRLLYELRDVTSTVDSLPLIVSSIMSKKIAGGARGIVIDVKTGSGAFLKKLEDSRHLAQALVAIGAHLGRKISALITDMSQPLGRMVGNALEVREAIDTLKGNGPQDLEDLCCALGAELVLFSEGQISDHAKAVEHLRKLLHDGSALKKFVQMVKNQGGNPAVVDDLDLLPRASKQIEISAPRTGVVTNLDALSIGRAANLLGAGRFTKDDVIDPAAGIEIVCKVGEHVNTGDPLAILYVNSEANLEQAKNMVAQAYTIGDKEVSAPQLIVERITGD
ncbi:MAG: thymidine phosphorylase [Candidatus Bipolaricaulota bacterium]|nr:thymidine phosphorylase [Candidatus Bipolaricaulota bacterium]